MELMQTLKMPNGWSCSVLPGLPFSSQWWLLGDVVIFRSWYCLVNIFRSTFKAFPELSLITILWARLIVLPSSHVTGGGKQCQGRSGNFSQCCIANQCQGHVSFPFSISRLPLYTKWRWVPFTQGYLGLVKF